MPDMIEKNVRADEQTSMTMQNVQATCRELPILLNNEQLRFCLESIFLPGNLDSDQG